MVILIVILLLNMIHPDLLPTLDVGPLTIRIIDAGWVLIIVGLYCWLCMRKPLIVPWELRFVFAPLLPFIIWIGLSVLTNTGNGSEQFILSLVSFARLCVTCIGGFLTGIILSSEDRLKLFRRFFLSSAVVTVIVAALMAAFDPTESVPWRPIRYEGIIGVNSLGMVSAMLFLYALSWPYYGTRWLLRSGALCIGILGLVLSRSASSIGAAAVMSAVVLIPVFRKRRGPQYIIAGICCFLTMVTMGVLAVWWGRSQDVEGLLSLESGSFAQRLALGYGGLLVFADHPLMGVGWQASVAEVVARTDILLGIFPLLPMSYFDSGHGGLSVHNLYVQIFAELGLIGFFLFGYGIFRIVHRLRMVIATLPSDDPGVAWVRWCGAALALLLFWWNTNPLYGGQTESILAMLLLGSIGAALGIARREHIGRQIQ